MESAPKTIRTTWAYALRKEELVTYLTKYHLDASGIVEELRKRWAKFLNEDHSPEVTQALLDLQAQHEASGSAAAPVSPNRNGPSNHNNDIKTTNTLQVPTMATATVYSPKGDNRNSQTDDRVIMIEVVRKWGIRYTGSRDVLSFVERVEELATMYQVSLNKIPEIMPELLKEKALIWYRNNNRHGDSWKAFKGDLLKFFLPPRYYELLVSSPLPDLHLTPSTPKFPTNRDWSYMTWSPHIVDTIKLDEEVRRRNQKPREPFKDYLLAIQELMRHTAMNDEEGDVLLPHHQSAKQPSPRSAATAKTNQTSSSCVSKAQLGTTRANPRSCPSPINPQTSAKATATPYAAHTSVRPIPRSVYLSWEQTPAELLEIINDNTVVSGDASEVRILECSSIVPGVQPSAVSSNRLPYEGGPCDDTKSRHPRFWDTAACILKYST